MSGATKTQIEIVMPRLSDSMEEGTIVHWLVGESATVKRGQPIVEIETDKATMEYEVETDGVISKLVVAEGKTAAVGAPIAVLETGSGKERTERLPGSASPDSGEREQSGVAAGGAARARSAKRSRARADRKPQALDDATSGDGTGRTVASPVARRLAREIDIDLMGVRGSGPGGRITKRDVELAAQAVAAPAEQTVSSKTSTGEADTGASSLDRGAVPSGLQGTKGEATARELTRTQQTVARRMAEAKATIPHFYLSVEIDMGDCVSLRDQLRDFTDTDSVPSLNDIIVKACALALAEQPLANGAYRDGRLELYSRVNVGIAVAAQDALIVPTVFDADRRSLVDIARNTRKLVERVRSGTITPPELSGATFTVSNLGMFGIVAFSPVINPPQAAILAVGEVTIRPVWDRASERFVPRQIMIATLASDHRVLYGADAARFLARVREFLEHPIALVR